MFRQCESEGRVMMLTALGDSKSSKRMLSPVMKEEDEQMSAALQWDMTMTRKNGTQGYLNELETVESPGAGATQ